MKQHSINMAVWFELPAIDFDRAINFYRILLGVEIIEIDMSELRQGLLPHDDKSLVSGAIVQGEGYRPSMSGSLVYLNGGDDLSNVLARVKLAGGEVLLPKTFLGEGIGYIGKFLDSEGNRVGLHSMN